MKHPLASIVIPGGLALVGLVLVLLWGASPLIEPLQARVPGLDRPAVQAQVARAPVVGQPVRLSGKASAIAGEWPWFRGAKLDGICADGVRLARQWPKAGPKKLWAVELGEGYAGAAVGGGCVFVLDYDQKAQADTMRCFSLDDGKEMWRNSYPVAVKRFHGMSRTVPALVGNDLVTLGPKCHVVCWDAQSGKSKWLIDLVLEHGATVPQWYAGQCPLIDNDRLILAPGGSALLMAVDHKSGQVLWKSANPHGWTMTHVSIVPMDLGGRRTYVYCGKGGVAGVAADDGSILWETTAWKIAIATVPSPVVLPGNRIFLSGGYNAGSMILEVKAQGSGFAAKVLHRFGPKHFDSIQQTPILYQNHLYGVRGSDKQLVCLDLDGTEVWTSGAAHKFGLGPYLIADGMIFVLDDFGLLTLAEATPEGYRQLSQAKVLDGHDAWGPMAMVAGRLILRDLTQMLCLDVAKE